MENQLIPKSESYKLIITEGLEKTIRELCNTFPKNEWSGTLFYAVSGSFENKDLVLTAVDLYLQDIGSGSFTEFQRDASLASYMLEHDLLDCYSGLVH